MKIFVIILIVSSAYGWGNISDTINKISDLNLLYNIATSEKEIQGFGVKHLLGMSNKDTKLAAFCRLGKIASAESMEKINQIIQLYHQKSTDHRLNIATMSLHPCWNFGDLGYPEPLAVTKHNGKIYGVFFSDRLGKPDMYLSVKDSVSDSIWSKPLLFATVGWAQYAYLEDYDGNHLKLIIKNQQKHGKDYKGDWIVDEVLGRDSIVLVKKVLFLNIDSISHDNDNDGLTDIEEFRYGLNPNNQDSDSDGIPDGIDPVPNTSVHNCSKTNKAILDAVFFAAFGLSNSDYLLLIENSTILKVHFDNYRGKIIYRDYNDWVKEHGAGVVKIQWNILNLFFWAKVEIINYVGPLAAGSQSFYLKRVKGRWVVYKTEIGWIS